jgi:hypothetical protein
MLVSGPGTLSGEKSGAGPSGSAISSSPRGRESIGVIGGIGRHHYEAAYMGGPLGLSPYGPYAPYALVLCAALTCGPRNRCASGRSHGTRGHGKAEGGLDGKVRELTLLTLLACLGLGLAWAYEADYFAMVFAVAAFAGVEAARRSL